MIETLTRGTASQAVEAIGWRYLLAELCSTVATNSLDQALAVSTVAVAACGADGAGHLRADLRPDRVELALQTRAVSDLTMRDVELAHGITDAVRELGLDTNAAGQTRPIQSLELAIDALDIGAVRPFWKAVLGYVDVPGHLAMVDLMDPVGQGPAVWFQQMDEPRPQRNRIHFDLTVAHDEAEARIAAALAAGGHLVSAEQARAFWVLADPEGNEVCVCTWQDRD